MPDVEGTMTGVTIGQAARGAGVGIETVRFYERQGLIAQPRKPDGSGVRHYSEDLIERIRFVREAQNLGFSLREVAELLTLRSDPASNCSDVQERATAKLRDVREKIKRLQQIDAALESLIDACPGRGGLQVCSIMDALTTRRATTPEAHHTSAVDGHSDQHSGTAETPSLA